MLKERKPAPLEVLAAWCQRMGLPEPVGEYCFAHPVREWRFDVCWPTLKIALEFEGGTFLPEGGGHTRGPGHRDDCDKYNEAALRGWLLLRVLTQDATRGKVYGLIQRAIRVRGGAEG